jgi:hypothetical protein
MGTSASSPGPGSNVPLVPRWVPAVPPPPVPPPVPPAMPPPNVPLPQLPANPQNPNRIPTPAVPLPLPLPPGAPLQVQLAPPRRFLGTRALLGRFAGSGSRADLRKGLGRYVRDGLAGSAAGARRMGTTARTASALYNTLSALQAGQATRADLGVDPATLTGRTAKEIMDVVVEAIRPNDGTQDAEANRQSIAIATADLLAQFPNADLTALSSDQIELLVERYVAHDLCQRVELDVGSQIEKKAPDAATAVRRLEEMKDFVAAEVHSVLQARRDRGERLQRDRVGALITATMQEIFRVFEEYLQ